MSARTIDLNADLGESPERLAKGSDAELMRHITSANVACGGHAGDRTTMQKTLELAQQNHVAVGAHPSYLDRAGFGRKAINLPLDQLQASITRQIEDLLAIARRLDIRLTHVKPHGALYHSCNHDADVARALGWAVFSVDAGLVVVGQAGFPCLRIYREVGLRAAAEAFADRVYEPDGTLRNRKLPGAVLDSAERAALQAVSIADRGRVVTSSGREIEIVADTLCIHSDTPNSAAIAHAVKECLIQSGIMLRPL